MLKSLKKLRDTGLCDYDPIHEELTPYDSDELADEIQAEIDKFYLPRPLFEDGEPVQFGDEYLGNDGIVRKVTSIHICADRLCRVYGGGIYHLLSPGDRLKRPPEPDTQKKIDADYRSETNNLIVDSGRGCMTRERALKYVERFDELMARQRKLDGVE